MSQTLFHQDIQRSLALLFYGRSITLLIRYLMPVRSRLLFLSSQTSCILGHDRLSLHSSYPNPPIVAYIHQSMKLRSGAHVRGIAQNPEPFQAM